MLNEPIGYHEIENAVKRLKPMKSPGIDGLPNEVLTDPSLLIPFCSLFNKCLDWGIIPSVWQEAIISPIPKFSTKDKFVPLNYRGISLLSNVYKLYSSILNHRLVAYLDNVDFLPEEQNGFRKHRSCEDHAFVLSSVISSRMDQNQPSFVAFIDFAKAFDWVDQELLLYKLLRSSADGPFYFAIKSMYTKTRSSVKVNDDLSNWYETECGVRQGDVLSPTLFNIFLNDLSTELNSLRIGITLGDDRISHLLYTDDFTLMNENSNPSTTWWNKLGFSLLETCRMYYKILEQKNNNEWAEVTFKVLKYTRNNNLGWVKRVKSIFLELDLDIISNDISHIPLQTVKEHLVKKDTHQWKISVASKPKLRTYALFKINIKTELYVSLLIPKCKRSIFWQFRSGILPLAIETGRYRNVPTDERLCEICNLNLVEDEIHFPCFCPGYQELRTELYQNVLSLDCLFPQYTDTEILMDEIFVKLTINFIYGAWQIRQNIMLN